MSFTILKDPRGHEYIEFTMSNGERVRITRVVPSWSSPVGIRLQIRETGGRLRRGPEIPSDLVSRIAAAMRILAR